MSSILGPEWHISSDGVLLVTDNGNIKDKEKIYKSALNFDLKEICSPMLTNELSKDKTSKIILQIQKIRNISAPKANEESQAAPRMLKLTLTDGDTYVQALEISLINAISRNKTPPGTKVLISCAKITSGCLLLNPSNCTILGGRVPHLVEKWEIAKSVQRNHRSNSGDDGPPPWVNFGTKIQNNNQESNFKSLGKNKDSTNKDNSEFELQRQGAIAEATSGATKKVFGGRVKHNIQPAKSTDNFKDKREHRSKAKFTQKEEISEKPQRPSEKVSLFSFLEDKLPVNETQSTARANTQPESNKLSNLQKGYQNQAQHQNKEFSFPHEKPLNQNNPNQLEKPYNNRNSTLQKEKPKSSENRVYSKSQAKSDNNQNSQNVYNDFNIPERLQKKQTDKSNSYDNQISFGNRNNNSFDKAQPKSFNHSQYSQKNTTNDFHQNSNQTNAIGHFEASDRLAQKPRDKDFNQNQNNGYNQNSSNRSQHKQNDNRYSSTSRNNYINRYETPDHKPSEKRTSNANNTKYNKYPTNNSCNTNYLNLQDKPQQKIDDSNTSDNINISQNEINDIVNNVERMSVNSQFASRSLRQYLNLGQLKKSETSVSKEEVDSKWKIGDNCLAKYWEDGQFYDASITAITDKTFVVKFKGYGNIEEILKSDCLPVAHSSKQDYNCQNRRYDQNTRQHSGSMEFRRSSRNYK